jgi:hypothetical protein
MTKSKLTEYSIVSGNDASKTRWWMSRFSCGILYYIAEPLVVIVIVCSSCVVQF